MPAMFCSPANAALLGGSQLPSLKSLGLVAAWDLTADGNDAHGANNLDSNNSPVFTANGVDLESGDVDSLSIADNAAMSIGTGNNVFVCAHINLESKPNSGYIMGKWATGAPNFEYLLFRDQSTDRILFIVSSNGTALQSVAATTFGALSLATDYFVYGFFDAANSLLGVGVNGVENTVSYAGGVHDGPSAFYIGGGPSGASAAFDGLIKYPRVFKPSNPQMVYLRADGKTRLDSNRLGLSYAEMN
jgi:hypothetical protein